jgi:hypothetical protein
MSQQEARDKLIERLDRSIDGTLNKGVFIIRWRGKPIETPSGKSAWKSKGAAGCALAHAFRRTVESYQYADKVSRRDNDYWKNIIEDLKQEGTLEVQEIE